MAREFYSASDAARTLGISLDTLRRWDRAGRISTRRDAGNRRIVPATEIDRLRGSGDTKHLSARNQFRGTVSDIHMDGLMAQVELLLDGPLRLVAIVTREAAEELNLNPGVPAAAVFESTSVMILN